MTDIKHFIQSPTDTKKVTIYENERELHRIKETELCVEKIYIQVDALKIDLVTALHGLAKIKICNKEVKDLETETLRFLRYACENLSTAFQFARLSIRTQHNTKLFELTQQRRVLQILKNTENGLRENSLEDYTTDWVNTTLDQATNTVLVSGIHTTEKLNREHLQETENSIFHGLPTDFYDLQVQPQVLPEIASVFFQNEIDPELEGQEEFLLQQTIKNHLSSIVNAQ